MRKKTMKEQTYQWALLAIAVAVMALMDWGLIQDPFRDGKVRYALLGAAGVAAWKLREAHPFAALFAFYGAFRWLLADMGSWGVLEVVMPFLMLFLASEFEKNFTVDGFARVVAYLALFQALYALLQVNGVEPWHELAPKDMNQPEFRGTAIGTLGHWTMLSPFVGLGLCYFVHARNWLAAGFCAMAIAVSDSTMGVLATAAGLAYMAFRVWPKLSLAGTFAALAGLGVWYYLEPRGGWLDPNGRLFIWEHAIRVWLQAPVLGHGPGSWMGLYPLWQIPGDLVWAQTHSDFVQVLPEYGALGLLLVAMALIYTALKIHKAPAFIGAWFFLLCTNASANFIFHVAAFGIPAAWLLVVTHRESGYN